MTKWCIMEKLLLPSVCQLKAYIHTDTPPGTCRYIGIHPSTHTETCTHENTHTHTRIPGKPTTVWSGREAKRLLIRKEEQEVVVLVVLRAAGVYVCVYVCVCVCEYR